MAISYPKKGSNRWMPFQVEHRDFWKNMTVHVVTDQAIQRALDKTNAELRAEKSSNQWTPVEGYPGVFRKEMTPPVVTDQAIQRALDELNAQFKLIDDEADARAAKRRDVFTAFRVR